MSWQGSSKVKNENSVTPILGDSGTRIAPLAKQGVLTFVRGIAASGVRHQQATLAQAAPGGQGQSHNDHRGHGQQGGGRQAQPLAAGGLAQAQAQGGDEGSCGNKPSQEPLGLRS